MRKVTSFLLLICIMLSLAVTSFAESDPTALKPGDIIALGTYEQDNVTGNGPEPIEWQVLDVDGDEAFLVSVHSLDAMKFNNVMKASAKKTLSWADSDIRTWLNGEFIDKAFSEEEKNCLITVENEEGAMDQVFLPSKEEIVKFFPSGDEQFCMPTEYAFVKQGSRDEMLSAFPTLDINNLAWYYVLRSFSSSGRKVALAPEKGMVTEDFDTAIRFVRPAIKISISTWASSSDKSREIDLFGSSKPSSSGGNKETDSVTKSYLVGYWTSKNGMHTFEMKKNGSFVTTVPVVPHCGDTYELVDGVIRSYYASNPSQKTDNLKITVVSDKEIEVYSYQTKATYTLYKRR